MYNYKLGASACRISINLAIRQVTRVQGKTDNDQFSPLNLCQCHNDLSIGVGTQEL